MADSPPERTTISFPPDSEIDLDRLDDLVDRGDYESRSELIRQAIADVDEDN